MGYFKEKDPIVIRIAMCNVCVGAMDEGNGPKKDGY